LQSILRDFHKQSGIFEKDVFLLIEQNNEKRTVFEIGTAFAFISGREEGRVSD
jgi:hypothetical protein